MTWDILRQSLARHMDWQKPAPCTARSTVFGWSVSAPGRSWPGREWTAWKHYWSVRRSRRKWWTCLYSSRPIMLRLPQAPAFWSTEGGCWHGIEHGIDTQWWTQAALSDLRTVRPVCINGQSYICSMFASLGILMNILTRFLCIINNIWVAWHKTRNVWDWIWKCSLSRSTQNMEFRSDRSEEIRPQRFSAGFTLLTAYYVMNDARWRPVWCVYLIIVIIGRL